MKSSISRLAAVLLCLSVASTVPQLLAKKKDANADSGPDAQKRALHALNRLTFGPRPGDVQQVTAMGVDRWIDLQLHPDKIPDDALQAHLEPLRTLHMNPRQLAENFPDNQMIKQVYDGKRPMPSDPAQRAIYQAQIARYEQKLADKQPASAAPAPASQPAAPAAGEPAAAESGAAEGAKTAEELAAAAAASPESTPPPDIGSPNAMNGGNGDTASAPSDDATMAPAVEKKLSPEEEAEARAREEQLYADLKTTSTVSDLIALPPNERYKKILAMSADEQFTLVASFRGGKGPVQEILSGLNPTQKETLMAMNNPPQVVVQELSQAKLLRAIYSDRQLEQVMTDFWFNHFNVFAGKGPERLLLTNYEQEVIRPHALGTFEDLLLATAKSPAMLFYLDNWMSVGPNSPQGLGAPQRPVVRYGPYGRPYVVRGGNPNARRKQGSGLNENYGRELLELHTLSVNGGYSQRDVTEVAKVFTGWTMERIADGAVFRYDPRMHEPGPKFVLGHNIKPKGEDEGREVIHLLATSPQTAHFISLKLAQRFVSDDPPPALVDRMAKTFEKKKGDIREVLLTLFHSPEFWSDTTYRAKVKTPLEFVASAVRATGADVQDALPLVQRLNNMGMPLYGAQPPTGYSMKADTWVSSSALLTRMNFALALTAGKVRGVTVDAVQLAGGPPPPPDPSATLSTMEAALLASDVSKQTHDSILAQLASPAKSGPEQNASGAKPGKQDANRPPDASTIAGLLLGSPEFQRR